jgi:hypothetical protein
MKDNRHETAVARYSGVHTPFLNIPTLAETLPMETGATNSEFTEKFTKMLEAVSRQKFTPATKQKVAHEVAKVADVIRNIVKAVKENKEIPKCKTLTLH